MPRERLRSIDIARLPLVLNQCCPAPPSKSFLNSIDPSQVSTHIRHKRLTNLREKLIKISTKMVSHVYVPNPAHVLQFRSHGNRIKLPKFDSKPRFSKGG